MKLTPWLNTNIKLPYAMRHVSKVFRAAKTFYVFMDQPLPIRFDS